ncbi:MAG: thiamine pyrophosphate-binding protein, partial [Rhodospirillales bacterium]|nr:thiamine pyrophosphate-binding protein [Rhodospirillales bacterium]
MSGETRTGGQVVIDILAANGIDRAYCVPGESYLGVLDAVREAGNSFTLHVCRQEGGAAYMAEAYACLTGRPGVCMVTRGPGACNAAIGIHTAEQEGVPMILLVGHTTTGTEGRVAFQEIDLAAFYGGMAKRVFVADRAEDIAGIMEEAVALSLSGRPGPVIVGLPEDIQLSPLPRLAPKPAQPPPPPPGSRVFYQIAQNFAPPTAPIVL